MILLVGLGNPGKEYIKTRHNLGFNIIDKIKDNYSFPNYQKKFLGLYSKKKIEGIEVILLKPQTFMNLSGSSVKKIVLFHKILNKNIIVFHDDLDMENGKLRVKQNGGHGGHNGIRDIILKIGNDFNRLKVGIKLSNIKIKAESFVLKRFSKKEEKEMERVTESISKNVILLIHQDYDKFFLNSKFSDGF